MKRNLHIYGCIISLFIAFTFQGCYKEFAIEDLGWPEEPVDPTIKTTAPTSGQLINISNVSTHVTVSGTVTGTNLKSLSYTLDGTEHAITSFNANSPDFSFDIDFANLAVGTTKNVSLKLTLKNTAGKEVSKTIAFKVKMGTYQNPTVTITSPTTTSNIRVGAAGTITITGTVQSQGASTYTYNIGNGEQPLTVTNNAFSQEISLLGISTLETAPVTLTITATDAAMQTGNKSVTFKVIELEPGLTAGNTGFISFSYAGTPVTHKTVRAKDGNIWLQQNLGASKVASSLTDVASYGDYFQWGRWADGHQKSNSAEVFADAINPNNPLQYKNPSSTNNPFVRQVNKPVDPPVPLFRWWHQGKTSDTWTAAKPEDITATNGCDPCKQAMGAGWRLPTKAEWEKIFINENIITLPSAFASTLKLPAAGYRHLTNGTLTSQRDMVFTWTGSTNYTTKADIVDIRTDRNAAVTDFGRGYGSTIRCIKKN